MKAIAFHGPGDVRLDRVPQPNALEPTDAIVRATAWVIRGTDPHMIRGTMPGLKPGAALGHEGVGVVGEAGQVEPIRVASHEERTGDAIATHRAFGLRRPAWIEVAQNP